ncbi:CAP domain-containing protein [Streptomyces sp. NBC_01217]|uniref:CAP domain-containing protein n=1 Tax=Streptomyces sp. NBC_01217 TaxID=2903779 RepID=UPI002E1517F6|nr:CAP domain-containing protein [Streptomyces sp. NBC_01217]
MSKHRKKTPRRRIIIAAVAVAAVGVPSVAMACFNPHEKPAAEASRTHAAQRTTHWGIADLITPASTPKPTATKTAPRPSATTKAPRPTATRTAPRPTAATSSPKPTATTSAPRPTATAETPQPTATTSTPRPTASASASATTAPVSDAVARILTLVNNERSNAGCSPLTLNAKLTKAAQAHSEDMAAHQNMSHTGSDGSDPSDRITSAGYDWSAYGENVAYGYSTPESVMAGWMESPGHKRNILDCSFKEIGVGLAQPGSYWTQDFATAR